MKNATKTVYLGKGWQRVWESKGKGYRLWECAFHLSISGVVERLIRKDKRAIILKSSDLH